MNNTIKSLSAKKIVFTLKCLFLFLYLFFLFSPSAYSDERVISIEPEHRDSRVTWEHRPSSFSLTVSANCRVRHTKFISWPYVECYPRATVKNYSFRYEYFIGGSKVELGGGLRGRDNIGFENLIAKDGDPVITMREERKEWENIYYNYKSWSSNSFLLMDFRRSVIRAYESALNHAESRLSKKRFQYIGLIALWCGIIALIIFLVIKLRRSIPVFKKWLMRHSKHAMKEWESYQVRKEAYKEAVKLTTRRSVMKASEEELDVLETQIADAIKRGDTELAKSLTTLFEIKKGDDK